MLIEKKIAKQYFKIIFKKLIGKKKTNKKK